ncbi:MAG TPA: efflux RND transporter periplasmic adaptor subunit [Xanthomonadaceae bacterium]|nr:efflux RND transporter periplasmic adaptor subunit [Xanthomonadaceae bacterium]
MPPSRSPRTPLRTSLLVAIVLAAALAALWWWRGHAAGEQAGGYRTAQVERGDIRVAISATGTLSAISTVTVGSQVSGQVTEVLVDFNDKVRRGQVIARIDPSTYEAQIAQGNAQIASAQAQLRQAEAALRNAELDYARKAQLGSQQLVAKGDVDQARAARDQAQAQVNAARAQIRQQQASTRTTRVNLDRTVIRSPVDGVVLTRSVEPGQTVAASLQAPELFTIAEDLSKMKIELAVDESDIGQVRAGQAVSFSADAFPNRQFRGTVEQVRLSATTTSNVVTYPVIVTVDNTDGTLLPGLTVNAEIEVSKRAGVLKVANAALRYKPADAEAATDAPSRARAPGGGVADDLARTAAGLRLDGRQQAAFDAALAAIRERQAARQAQPGPQQRGMFGGGGPRFATGGGGPDLQAQVRQRMRERFEQDFAAFRATLGETQRRDWDAAVTALVGATRAPVYKLVDGKPQRVMVRVGASDGSDTEISGDVREGDLLVIGERAAQ